MRDGDPLIGQLTATHDEAVLSGPERRRRWSASHKSRIVEESLAPGVTVAEAARRHDVHANLLHYCSLMMEVE
jgi:hypothetical protein